MTALTPNTVRLDLKCGKGSISKGEKCHKGPATQVREFAEKVAPAALGLGVAAGLIALRRRGRANAQRTRELPKVPSDPPVPPRSTTANAGSMHGRGERLANAVIENNKRRLREDPEGVRRQMRTSSPRAAYAGLMEELSRFNKSRRRRYTESSQQRSAPTLEQWGQAAQQGPEALREMMTNNSSTNRRTRIKRRKRPGLLQPPRRDVYAPGFHIDYDQLIV